MQRAAALRRSTDEPWSVSSGNKLTLAAFTQAWELTPTSIEQQRAYKRECEGTRRGRNPSEGPWGIVTCGNKLK